MNIVLISFGHKNGKSFAEVVEDENVHIFNCRNLPNPSQAIRRKQTGQSKDLREDFFSHTEAEDFFQECKMKILKDMENNTTTNLVYAFGCEKGKHRSVSMAERMIQELKDVATVTCIHRDLNSKTNPREKDKKIKDERRKKFSNRDAFE